MDWSTLIDVLDIGLGATALAMYAKLAQRIEKVEEFIGRLVVVPQEAAEAA